MTWSSTIWKRACWAYRCCSGLFARVVAAYFWPGICFPCFSLLNWNSDGSDLAGRVYGPLTKEARFTRDGLFKLYHSNIILISLRRQKHTPGTDLITPVSLVSSLRSVWNNRGFWNVYALLRGLDLEGSDELVVLKWADWGLCLTPKDQLNPPETSTMPIRDKNKPEITCQ